MTHYDNTLCEYRNGNYRVVLLEDGTKIRETEDNEFVPAFAENCDVKITDRCDGGCPYCYEGCTLQGKHAKLFYRDVVRTVDREDRVLYYNVKYEPAQEWLRSLHPGTELALNGNDLTHPDLNPEFPVLLHWLKDHGVIANMTVNQKHFMKHYDTLKKWCDKKLIWGLGVSMTNSDQEGFFEKVKSIPNAVIHTIAGVLTYKDILNIVAEKDLKVLILGYKTLGRGTNYATEPTAHVKEWIEILKTHLTVLVNNCKVVSFDNLALDQLDVRNQLFSKESGRNWDEFFMGEDGTVTYYIDAVKEQYAKNSCMPPEERFSSKGLTVDEMFKNIREKYASCS